MARLHWPALRLPPINLLNAPRQPDMEDENKAIALRTALEEERADNANLRHLITDIRNAAGDTNGRLMLDELVENIAHLRKKSSQASEAGAELSALHKVAHALRLLAGTDVVDASPDAAKKMTAERDALAAHAKSAKMALQMDDSPIDPDGVLCHAMQRTPEASLDRRDAAMKAEGAKAIRHLTQGEDWEDDELRQVIDDCAAEYRRQAQGGDA